MTALLAALVLTAEPSRVVLHHTNGVDCAGQTWLEGNVTARLGFSPFVTESPIVATTHAACTASGCQAELELAAPGKPPRRRALTGPPRQCNELMESLALALSLAIDPQLLSRPAPPPEPSPQPIPEPVPPPRVEPPAPPPPPRIVLVEAPRPPPVAVHFQGVLAGHAALGLSPYPTGGGSIGIGFRVGWFGVLAEGRFDLPQRVTVARPGRTPGAVSSSVLLGSLVPCGHFKGLGLCLVASAGGLQVTGDLAGGIRSTSPLLLVGGRLLYEWMFLAWLGLHAHVNVAGVVTRTTVVADEAPVWVTAQVAGEGALGLVVLF